MINTKTMTITEIFGYTMASRGVTSNSTVVEVMQALVDTTRQATDEVADVVAGVIIYDFIDGKAKDYMDVLTENEGEYVSNVTDEVVSVPMLP